MNNKYLNERWKRIQFDEIHPDENVYVSDYGRIKSFKTSRKGGKIIGGSWLSEYNILVLKKIGDKRKTVFIHKLIAAFFLDKPKADAEYVIHLDFNRKNNFYENLKWVNRKGASAHRRKDKNYHVKKIRNAKLTAEEVKELKIMLKEGKKRPYRIAQRFGITHTQLNRIRTGENWGHIKID